MPEIDKVTLHTCPVCEDYIVVVDGKVQGIVTFWMNGDVPSVTPHKEGCELSGTAIPANLRKTIPNPGSFLDLRNKH